MIEEAYVSFEIAKLLIKKGFNESTLVYAYSDDMIGYYSQPRVTDKLSIDSGRLPLPTHQMAMRWLREVHNLCIEPYRTACGYLYTISRVPTGSEVYSDKGKGDDEFCGQWTTYEKAVEAAIKYCLENLI